MKNFSFPIHRQVWAVFACTFAITLALSGTGAHGQPVQVIQSPVTATEMGLAKALGTTDDAGEAIRAYMAEGIINKRPNQRLDYTDYYVVNKPAQFLGHELQLIEQEYMTTYVGCCVSPGTGLTVRLNGSPANLRQFAIQNRCSFEDNVNFQEVMRGFKLTSRPGNYASISCRERDQESAAAAKAGVPPSAASKQASAADKRKTAETKLPESVKALVANGSGPMLCALNGQSKPTVYLDLAADFQFKLVRDGRRAISGKWHSGSFQGQPAIILQTPPSSGDSFPDLYTAYEESIKFAQGSLTLSLARRSTFPSSRSAEAYATACVEAKSLTLEQAEQLTRANVENNPLLPEAQVKRQQAEANRPSAAHCTRLEDLYADRPALQKQLLMKIGCT
ncbi:MAG: hypothetical protein EON54_01865 [Alcaligenaceae bacterium]|nr:MAG: hypothetical protein EON54_01865 [Alcaligenaceae bacterium]